MMKHHPEFRPDPLGTDHENLFGTFADDREAGAVESKVESSGEADGSQHPQLIFGDPFSRVTDGAHHSLLEIALSADEIEQTVFEWVEEHAVDREISPLSVLLGRAVSDMVWMATVRVGGIATEGGNFDRTDFGWAQQGDYSEGRADGQGAVMAE